MNVCAVRMRLCGNDSDIGTDHDGMPVFRHPLPHEPVMFDAKKPRLMVDANDPVYKCRHCGCLYPDEDQP